MPGGVSLNWMFHSLENDFYFWSNFGVKSFRFKYFALMPEKIILPCILVTLGAQCSFYTQSFQEEY